MPSGVQVKLECSRVDGYLAIYIRFRQGKVHKTYELSPGLAADVDREGRVLGVEVVRTFSTKAKRVLEQVRVELEGIQRAVEDRFGVSLDEEFKEVRTATSAFA